ncbi:hypothetical protein M9H77_02840 [Catharanthus roseus]|uniref:Uncharacterized protein n=1 Tax=Catharanthus roseus TaxID=4058 RepID=A0ACC0C9U0_CATRO|nr:hypothetical protein M9H77_02840 [Catharanthus roseus]
MWNHWNILACKASLNGIRGTELRDRKDGKAGCTRQKDLTERFSCSKYLEELHMHQKGEKKGERVDFRSTQFWKKFHEVRRKAEEDVEVSGTPMPDDLQLMTIVAGGVNRSRLYGAGLEVAQFKAESSRTVVGLVLCCLDHEQRLMWRDEDTVSRVSAAFDEHMRRQFEYNQLTYIPFPAMMPLVEL